MKENSMSNKTGNASPGAAGTNGGTKPPLPQSNKANDSGGANKPDHTSPTAMTGPPSKAAIGQTARDLLPQIKGMYRFLDVVSEQGNGGVVDKIVIDDVGVSEFVNNLHPGAYKSVSSVDFAALDTQRLQLVGIYGSRDEIVRFLLSHGHIDNRIAELLRKSQQSQGSPNTEPYLRSGLYILDGNRSVEDGHRTYVIYWSEDATWNSQAPSSTRKNRIAFMRYLTKLADQILVFVSPEHAKTIVWKNDVVMRSDEDDRDLAEDDEDDDESYDRFFAFSVEKTAEQEEGVLMRTGFEVHHAEIIPRMEVDGEPDAELLAPRLALGETSQGFITTNLQPATTVTRPFREPASALALRRDIEEASVITIGPDVSDEGIETLVANGLQDKAPDECRVWRDGKIAARKKHDEDRDNAAKELTELLKGGEQQLKATVFPVAVKKIVQRCPPSVQADFGQLFEPTGNAEELDAHWAALEKMYPDSKRFLDDEMGKIDLTALMKNLQSKRKKSHLHAADSILKRHPDLTGEQKEALVKQILEDGKGTGVGISFDSGKWAAFQKAWSWVTGATEAKDELRTAITAGERIDDLKFYLLLPTLSQEPLFVEAASVWGNLYRQQFKDRVESAVTTIFHRVNSLQERVLRQQSEQRIKSNTELALVTLRDEFVCQLLDAAQAWSKNGPAITYSSVEKTYSSSYSTRYSYDPNASTTYRLAGDRTFETHPTVKYTIYPFDLKEEDKQNLRMDCTYIPRPIIEPRFKSSFSLPTTHSIRHFQLLSNGRCFLIVAGVEALMIYMEPISQLEAAVSASRHKTRIPYERIGRDFVLSVDESKHAMAIMSTIHGEYSLNIFECDDGFTTIHMAPGSPISLTPWFTENPKAIRHICFAGGADAHIADVCLIDENNLVRIFSMLTAQFRPATLTLQRDPIYVGCSPDNACLCSVGENEDGTLVLEAIHWASFGSTSSHVIPLPDIASTRSTCMSLSSFVDRSAIHLLILDVDSSTCRSFALDISKRSTEYALKSNKATRMATNPTATDSTNALIECLSDVWTRFPVVPTLSRATITSGRATPRLTFVTDRDHERYAPHFTDTILAFEQTTRKPTGKKLSEILVSALPFEACEDSALKPEDLSSVHAGEWLIEAMCLIPIQIAITRENRFLPLKDGVWSADLERSLLGASVNQVANSLSLGWYESIFSYPPYKQRPVKVVSSMGEQSVGKSYTLNSLLDTSFAGSAMRCTEGVWMSCTPTDDALIVALDFEGVQSIERSAQEDTLLVLFNTAISNMILFRNNFALSRDVAGLFTSFQSASAILEPGLNPTLFQSILLIIIKDVIDNDKLDMVREFQLKFTRIVAEEQSENFLSRAHRGKFAIIPWPVIESRQFYDLFGKVGKSLAKQPVSHATAAGFVRTLKTLMAKIKTHDWGALDQNLASQRIEELLRRLPAALMFGLGSPAPHDEPLKNLDDDTEISHEDSQDEFYFASADGDPDLRPDLTRQSMRLDTLRTSTRMQSLRQTMPDSEWLDVVSQKIKASLDRRLQHVGDWIAVNTARFGSNSETLKLRRTVDAAFVDVQAGVEFCRASCAECNLLCVLPRRHDGNHHCKTRHRCKFRCDILDGHDDREPCGLPAGHSSVHICDVSVHLCGQPCVGAGQSGCLKLCSKTLEHEGEHFCAGQHACGMACDLDCIELPGGEKFNCPGLCVLPWNNQHMQHSCAMRMCPVTCALCKRLCVGSHFHGQEPGAVHLCDQEHRCKNQCTANGVCEISTVPHAIESTFTGRHEVFTFTKYTQDVHRHPCEIKIPSGQLSHDGPHCHTLDPDAVHFCDVRCPMCDYVCTLPYGHPQAEHDTSHGSMSKTQWALDGGENAILEIDGHKFAANDAGAPMLCNSVCEAQGRHVHLDYCRATSGTGCAGNEIEHLTTKIGPDPDRPKDAISHSVFWKRSGFRDPYSREHRDEFAKCDHLCCGEEHKASTTGPARPSFCTLPMFHAPHTQQAAQGVGYVSDDGHHFSCVNPAVSNHAYHVIFLIDRSGSMSSRDRHPLSDTPVYGDIRRVADNRLGAVYSSLFGFWTARAAAVQASGTQAHRRDSYSIVLFNHSPTTVLENDFNRNPRELVQLLLNHQASGGTSFNSGLQAGSSLMQQHWRTDQRPVVIFLSDGEDTVTETHLHDMCRRSLALGAPLAFHTVSFGPDSSANSLRRMANIAQQHYANAPRTAPGPGAPANNQPQCTFSQALDSVQLTETFLGIAASLRKTRGSLMKSY